MQNLIKFYIDGVARQQYGNKIEIIKNFTKFCLKSLGIFTPYDVHFVSSRKKYGIKTTAECEHSDKKILIYVKGRALSDVMKSLSHELVHVKQHEDGEEVKHEFVHFHSQNEDDANVMGVALFNAYAEVLGNDLIFEN